MVEDLLEVLGNEDKVDTAEAKLWDLGGLEWITSDLIILITCVIQRKVLMTVLAVGARRFNLSREHQLLVLKHPTYQLSAYFI